MELILLGVAGAAAVAGVVVAVTRGKKKKDQAPPQKSISWAEMTQLKKDQPKDEIDVYIEKTIDYKIYTKEPAVVEQLTELEGLLKKTDDFYTRNPEVKSRVDAFLDKYMPTMFGFAQRYYKLTPQSEVKLEAEQKMTAEVVRGMGVINDGLRSFLNGLYDDVVTNISVDTEVINSILGADGYFALDDIAKHFQSLKEDDGNGPE